MEIWKYHKGKYYGSSEGRIKSVHFNRETILTPGKQSNGYLGVVLYFGERGNKTKESLRVHNIIADLFLSNDENFPTVNHINGIKTDNRVINLERLSHSGNRTHAHVTGLYKTKLNPELVREIREKYKTGKYTYPQLSKEYNVTVQTIGKIIRYKIWKTI